jgi:YYY domain-containing protein
MNYREKYFWIYDILFLLILVLAGYLRLTGVNWGEGQGQHPDENTFSGVLGAIRAQKCVDELIPVDACPVEQRRWLSLTDYFDNKTSPLNPYNRGYGSYVYGDLPMIAIRVAADLTNQTDGRILGRQVSALADLLAIVFLYLIVARLYDRRVALLASLFSALAVMQIQQSHFFTIDLFVNTFSMLAIWFAVEIMMHNEQGPESGDLANFKPLGTNFRSLLTNPLLRLSLGFGVAYGMALASKLNIYPLAVLLPGAFVLRYFINNQKLMAVDDTFIPLNTDQPQTVLDREASAVSSDVVSGEVVAKNRWSLIADQWPLIIACLIAGGLATVLSFRIFQPYAFDGLKPDPRWVADITQQRAQATGEADMPWNLQWARRSHLYSFTNLTAYGLGLPLGILAWIGFLYMGWRIVKGEWQHALLWGWTAAYFLWQSMQFNPTMRYQLPIYPLLAMMAAWFVFELAGVNVETLKRFNLRTILASTLGITVVILTAAWAFAFHSIYIRDEPRIAASRWIFQNVPGPINLKIQQADASTYNQPLPFPTGIFVQPEQPYQTSFVAQSDGSLQEIFLAHVAEVPSLVPAQLQLTVWQDLNDPQPLGSAFTMSSSEDASNTLAQVANFDQSLVLNANQTYYLRFELSDPQALVHVCGSMRIILQVVDQVAEQFVNITEPCTVTNDTPYTITFVPQTTGTLNSIELEHVTNTDLSTLSETHTLSVFVSNDPNSTELASASTTKTFASVNDPRGDAVTLKLNQPVTLIKGTQYFLRIEVSDSALTLSGSAIANETDFDYGLPMRVDGYDAFGGLYRGDLNLQVYWDDNTDKLNRFIDTLSQTDYILIPTNHQYAQISRVPERYPLTAYYYRELMGCPPQLETIPCYHEAKPGDYKGRLGFELAAVFETFPKLGDFEVNDQYAEEAFTFYDHPKVLIFKKAADFDAEQVLASLSTVDLTKVVRLLPTQFDDYSTLQLPPERLATQRAGGTWSQLFDYAWIQNRYPVVGLLIWYIFIFILGLATYPIIRIAMPGLADKGYPLSRALGLVIFGYLAWLAGSVGISVTRTTVIVIFGLLIVIGAILGHLQRDALKEEWRTKGRYFLMVEGLFLLFFLIDLFIRIGNPDMWHPAKGGERPMDFSYFNAVIKSTTFPPYDPWFAGGYINYYYYGFVLVVMPVKLLGIVPSIAYNFILPTLFAMVGICAFSIGWNLVGKVEGGKQTDEEFALESSSVTIQPSSFIAGLSASFLTILLGNLGTIQLLYNKLQELGSLGTFSWESTFVQRLTWAIEGMKMVFSGVSLPIGFGNWYWDPSRVIPPGPGNEITEFPLFTFLYSDLHAHMIVMPIALLALSWALSVVAGRVRWQNQASAGLGIVIGGLIIGAAYPTNLSDSYTYLLIGIIALAYSIWRYSEVESITKRIVLIIGAVIALYLLSTYLYLPYRTWYAQAYSSLDPWKGPFTPVASYLTHWGVFLFILVSWMTWETREWMANTPLSALRKLKPYQLLIEGALIGLVVIVLATQYIGTSVGWIALPIATWAGVLLLNPRLPDTKRLVLFLIGTAMFITILVEVVFVQGDIGRANTIFKFYLQAWLMLAVSGGAALAWTLPAFFQWLPGWRVFWQTAIVLLIAGAAMFTVSGTAGKVRDRWIVDAPRALDAMTFMNYAHYDDFGQRLDLSEDYGAIRWMQENVQGSPVIVETNCPEYHWCTRFTIYTGLPGVVGWNFHQRQQRAFTSTWVEQRVAAVGNFYNSIDVQFTRDFLKTYDVKYIIEGQLERAAYTPEGIAKFERFDGELWKSVYRDGSTVIYEVIP